MVHHVFLQQRNADLWCIMYFYNNVRPTFARLNFTVDRKLNMLSRTKRISAQLHETVLVSD